MWSETGVIQEKMKGRNEGRENRKGKERENFACMKYDKLYSGRTEARAEERKGSQRSIRELMFNGMEGWRSVQGEGKGSNKE